MLPNDQVWSYEFERNKVLQAGAMILSEPFLDDENFRRTVVLICEHQLVSGTIGLILNKRIKLPLNELVEDFPDINGKVYFGGPVSTDALTFLHSLGDELEGTIRLSEHLYWGGNFEQLKRMIKEGKAGVNDVHFFLGYAGWAAGQLEEELKENSWIVAKSSYKYVFQTAHDELWKSVMINMGGVYQTMASYPENPALN